MFEQLLGTLGILIYPLILVAIALPFILIGKLISAIGKGAGRVAESASETALMKAAKEGDIEKVKTLLSSGPDVNRRTMANETALTLCLRCINPDEKSSPIAAERLSCQQEIAMMLLRQGAGYLEPDKNGEYPLVMAMERGMSDAALFMIDNTDAENIKRLECLVLACKKGLSHELIQKIATIDPEAIHTALCAAASVGEEGLARILLNMGANMSQNPIVDAVKVGCVPLVEEFLRRGDSPNAVKDKLPCAALALNRTDILRLLLDAGADGYVTFSDPRPGQSEYRTNLFEYANGFPNAAQTVSMLHEHTAKHPSDLALTEPATVSIVRSTIQDSNTADMTVVLNGMLAGVLSRGGRIDTTTIYKDNTICFKLPGFLSQTKRFSVAVPKERISIALSADGEIKVG